MNSNSTADLASQALSRVGLSYGIAIAVGILVLVSTIMLASYVCVRVHGRAQALGLDQGLPGAAMGAHLRPNRPAEDWVIGGLDQETLETYPKFMYSPQHPLPHADATSCSICLSDYKDDEVLRMLPDCRHVFHAQCIDSWLRLHPTCPMCRTSPIPTPQPTPLSTPLSELIPLARNPLQTQLSASRH